MTRSFYFKLWIQTFIACIAIGLTLITCEPQEFIHNEEKSLVTDQESAILTELDTLFDSRAFVDAVEVSRSYLIKNKPNSLKSGLIMIKLFQALNYIEKEDSSNLVFSEIILFAENELNEGSAGIVKGKAYLSKAKILQDLNLFDSSSFYLNIARKHLPESYIDDYAYSYILSTKVAYYNYNNHDAKAYLKLAENLNSKAQLSDRLLTLIDNWYCLVLEWDGEFEKAINRSENILSRYSKKSILHSSEETILLNTYQNLGTIYTSKGDIAKGINYYSRALNYATSRLKPNSADIASLLNNVGYGLMMQYNYSEAINHLTRSNKILSPQKGDDLARQTKIETYLHLAFCYQEKEILDSALYYSHLALKLQQSLPVDLDYTYFNISTAHYLTKNYQAALDTINLSIAQTLETYGPRHKLVSRSFSLLGKILEGQSKYKESLAAFQSALISSSRIFSKKHYSQNPKLDLVFDERGLLKNLGNKVRLLLKLYQQEPTNFSYLSASWETNLTALNVIEHLRNDYSDDESKFHLLKNAIPIYESGLKTATLLNKGKQDQKLLAQAFNISEQGKSMILQDNMRSAFALQSPEIPENMRIKEDSLSINIAFYGSRVNTFRSKKSLGADESVQYKNAQRIFLESEEAYSNLMQYFEKNYQEYSRRKKSIESLSLDRIQSYLDSAHLTLIEYFWGEKSLYAFLLHQGQLQMIEIPKDKQLEDDMETWRNSISNSTEVYNQGNSPKALATFKRAGHNIYKKILAPLLKSVPEGRDLVIIPDGPLNLFPFDALLYSQQDTINKYENMDYLLHHHQIQYALSAGLLLKGDTHTHTQSKYDFLGYAPTYKEARRLDFNEQEVQKIAELVDGKAMIGPLASKASFNQHAHEARFLHLSQHAINEQDPLMSYLLFSTPSENDYQHKNNTSFAEQEDPQKLHAYEIYNQKLPCALAVLNACETGEGMLIQGEGMLSLSRAFRYAGAESVIMNKWRVNDEASFRILSNFYALLKKGHNTASALRESKIHYLKSSNKTHPYFWAGSALIGNSKKPAFKTEEITLNSGPDYWLFVGLWALGILFLLGIILKLSNLIYPKHSGF